MNLGQQLQSRRSEFLLFAMTPPRETIGTSRAQELAEVTRDRLDRVNPDGLILYDIDDESDRNPQERPFPFLPTMDPATFRTEHLAEAETFVIVYRCVGKYTSNELVRWIGEQDVRTTATVFVGASSVHKRPTTSLGHAQRLWAQTKPDLQLGGVAIPERHTRRDDEHLRLLAKQDAGCSFFITQVVYDVNAAKNLISDYRFECARRGSLPVPIVFTFSVCGSLKTLDFLTWLGVDVPRWIQNDLRHADDTLQASYEHAIASAHELIRYCRSIGVPFGINVESVSTRLVEIEASVELALELQRELLR